MPTVHPHTRSSAARASRRRLPPALAAALLLLLAWPLRADSDATPAPPPPRPHGVAINATKSTVLLVVADGRVHRLQPGHRSPPGIDADGLRAEDGTPIRGHAGWWKFPDGVTATVRDTDDGGLAIRGMLVLRVGEHEFGRNLRMVEGEWGVPIEVSNADASAPGSASPD